MARTKLEVVVQLREREEDKALRALSDAERKLHEARLKAQQAAEAAKRDERTPTDAATWAVIEAAHGRALFDAKKSAREADTFAQATERVRAQYPSAYQRAEVVRRISDARELAANREVERKETKDLDEIAAVLFTRKAS